MVVKTLLRKMAATVPTVLMALFVGLAVSNGRSVCAEPSPVLSSPMIGQEKACGSMGPYLVEVLREIGKHWHAQEQYAKRKKPIVISIAIAKTGEVVSSEVFQSCGAKTVDAMALSAVRASHFSALPSWCTTDVINIRTNFDRVEFFQHRSQAD